MLEPILTRFDDKDKRLILRAFEFAQKAHQGQKRLSGDDYITHCVEVAKFLSGLNFDSKTIAAALLHDVLEDTEVNKEKLEKEFGKEVTFLVDGVTRLKKIKYKPGQITDVDVFKKTIFAMADDLRVIFIKLSDRLHNLATLEYVDKEKQKRIAKESIEIYAPIADRLGMGELKRVIDDLSFPYAYPEEYKKLKEQVRDSFEDRLRLLERIKPVIADHLKTNGLDVIDIHSRAKHYYSLFKKLKKKGGDINKIYDLAAIRIIFPTVANCYEALGLIHKLYKPLIGQIKDYIAVPKINGYQSLHTAVIVPKGKIIEIQLRTPYMHYHAEFGIASHWAYGEAGKINVKANIRELAWVNKIREWKEGFDDNPEAFFESIKKEFFSEQVYVFTPDGDIKELPEGSTPIDFAYKIHSEVGDQAVGAKVDGKMVPLSYELKNGEVVEILTSKTSTPSLDWLNFVKTKDAQKRIRNWFKNLNYERNLEWGEKILNKELKVFKNTTFSGLGKLKKKEILDKFSCKDEKNLFVLIGKGSITPKEVIREGFKEEEILQKKEPKKKIIERIAKTGVVVGGHKDLLIKFAHCCLPQKDDKIVGYITKNSGVSIHKSSCKNISNFNREKIISAVWEKDEKEKPYEVKFSLKVKDRIGLLKDVGSVFDRLGINISNFRTDNKNHNCLKLVFTAHILSLDQLEEAISKLRLVENVVDVKIV